MLLRFFEIFRKYLEVFHHELKSFMKQNLYMYPYVSVYIVQPYVRVLKVAKMFKHIIS